MGGGISCIPFNPIALSKSRGASLQETSCMSVTERKPVLGAEECMFTLVQIHGVCL
jgi:hypothetical protein